MDNSIVYWLDGMDRQLMLILNYDGGVVQDWCWQACSSRLIWVLPAMYFVYRLFARQRRWADAAVLLLGLVLTVTLCDQVSSGLIKPLVGRLRPSHAPALAGLLHLVDGYRGGLYGFVSSHAANAFGAVVYVALTLRRRRMTLAMVALALAVSYSRIYLGVHYPGDVLAGALLGAVIGALTYGMALGLCWALPRFEVRYATLLLVCVFSMCPVHAQRGAGSAVHRVAATCQAVSASAGQAARPAMLAA